MFQGLTFIVSVLCVEVQSFMLQLFSLASIPVILILILNHRINQVKACSPIHPRLQSEL